MDLSDELESLVSPVTDFMSNGGWQVWLMGAGVAVGILLLVSLSSFSARRAGTEWHSDGRRGVVVAGWSSVVFTVALALLGLLAYASYVAWGALVS